MWPALSVCKVNPPSKAPRPLPSCCKAALTLRKAPRLAGSGIVVISACKGMLRPETDIMKNGKNAITANSGSCGMCVMNRKHSTENRAT